jgi:hypothetical protein
MSEDRALLLLSCSNRKASGGTSAWEGGRFFPDELSTNRGGGILDRRNKIQRMLRAGPPRLYDKDRNGGYRDESPPNFYLASGRDFGDVEPALYRLAYERYTGRFFGMLERLAPNFWKQLPSSIEILFLSGLYGLEFWDESIQDYDCHFADYSDPENVPKSRVSTHWGDELSDALIEFLQRQPRSAPIRVVYDLLSEELYQSLFDWKKIQGVAAVYHRIFKERAGPDILIPLARILATNVAGFGDGTHKDGWHSLTDREGPLEFGFECAIGRDPAATREGEVERPRKWIEWVALLARTEFNKAIEVAERAVNEWSVDQQFADPSAARAFARVLLEVPDGLASERLYAALPIVIEWLRRDKAFPRPALHEVYERIWELLVLGVRRGEKELEASAALFEGLLASGLSANRYKSLLSEALELAGDPGRKTAYWLLGFVEATVDHPAPDAISRSEFWAKALGRLDALQPLLTPLQQLLMARIAATLGIPVAPPPVIGAPIPPPFDGQRLAIYTLTESAGRQAEAVLLRHAPAMDISLHWDLVGSQQLKAAAEHADIFVIVTCSAKHAATEFIRRWRPRNRPLLFAPGPSASSILRALDEHFGG